jgi:hypothetical protein
MSTDGDGRKLLTGRNVIGLFIVAVLVLVGGWFFVLEVVRQPDADLDCDALKEAELSQSQELLVSDLTSQIAMLDTQIAALDTQVEGLEQEEQVLSEQEESLQELGDSLSDVSASIDAQSEATTEENQDLQELGDDLEKVNLRTETLDKLRADREAAVENLSSLQLTLDQKEAAKTRAETGDDSKFSPPRSAVNLTPNIPVSKVSLGSDRDSRRVEIVLSSELDTTAVDSETDAAQSSEEQDAELPDVVELLSITGQFRRSEGVEIPADQMEVWTRRISAVRAVMTVCITPGDQLDAGSYTGNVFLVDPAVNQMTVAVEIKAQSHIINFLYGLLIISPILGFLYVWATARYTAGAEPWKWDPFWNWFEQNFILAFALGFAAVWATLQVPFNNPTWGSSVLNAAAVIGVGLVAAVTAMTAVTGVVVGDSIDKESPKTESSDIPGPVASDPDGQARAKTEEQKGSIARAWAWFATTMKGDA